MDRRFIVLIIILMSLIYLLFSSKNVSASTEDVKAEIIKQSVLYKIDPKVSLRIAKCESNFNEFAKNKRSSAKGVYQFINKTWKGYCSGDVFDYKANIQCFMKLYKKYPNWWSCR